MDGTFIWSSEKAIVKKGLSGYEMQNVEVDIRSYTGYLTEKSNAITICISPSSQDAHPMSQGLNNFRIFRCACFADRRVCKKCQKMRIGCALLDAHVLQTGGSVKKCLLDAHG